MQCQKLRTYMESGRVIFLPARTISSNPEQPRRVFSPEALQELADSIRQHGVLQPLSVRRVGTGHQLISGERRLRAAILAGLTDVPCIVMRMEEQEQAVAALVENLQREDLDFIEEARALASLTEKWGMRQEQAARLVGKSQSAVANKLRILRHSDGVLQALRKAGLTERHARALLQVEEDDSKLALIALAEKQKLSVQQLESRIAALLAPVKSRTPKAEVGSFLRSVNTALERIRTGGVAAISEHRETDSQIVVTITIPK